MWFEMYCLLIKKFLITLYRYTDIPKFAAKLQQIFEICKIFSKKIIDLLAKRRFLGIV